VTCIVSPKELHLLTKWFNFMVNKEMAESQDAESRILHAAREVFLAKGMHGARTQEIADKAGINKAMLHYYYRTKQQLFEAVFRSAFMEMAPRLHTVLNGDGSVSEKIDAFCSMYIAFIIQQPYLPAFIVNELNRDPGFLEKVQAMHLPNIGPFLGQLDKEMVAGRIKVMDPRQLFINMMALCIFPFIGAPLLKLFARMDDSAFDELLKQRQTGVATFILDAINIES
jgi:TetR/AcrR family transcriptional regulator